MQHDMLNRVFAMLAVLSSPGLIALAADSFPPIPRVLPPEGLEIPADVRGRLEKRLEATKRRLEAIGDDQKPDVEVFTKAVELALIHREFYVEKDLAKADWALGEANQRLDSLAKNESPWRNTTGTVVAGYRSSIDGSAQPFGLVIPKDHDFIKPCPLYVWLHGRGDKATDLHFLQERATKPGQITPPGAIVAHPFGRHCVGWKHAGEIDVLEVVNDVKRRYRIDPDRIVLIGFSMGGAGAWHIGAHYADHWVAVSPGAGFVDVNKYQKLTPENSGEWYVQKLWGLYDVPDYVRNFFNTNVIAYSGELDKQREAAVLMEDAFKAEGRTLTHLIGPGVEHKYEPETLKELLKRIEAIVEKGRDTMPNEVHLQTRTLRYPKAKWVVAHALDEHWNDSRIDAVRSNQIINVKTKNIKSMSFVTPRDWAVSKYVIDGQPLGTDPNLPREYTKREPTQAIFSENTVVKETGGGWVWGSSGNRKVAGRQGPIDDAFMKSFVVVTPTGQSRNPTFQKWCDAELQHFRDRWRALMRGNLPEVTDAQFNFDKHPFANLILWGDADSNSVIMSLQAYLPVRFNRKQWTLGETTYDGDRFAPVCIFPIEDDQHLILSCYVVLNSGLTFREAHDRTNSQQNPKLPDWAIVDISQPPDANAPGRIHDADFFDENWQLKRQPKGP
jgi:hypothetical protein